MFVGFALPSMNLDFDFGPLDDIDDEEEIDFWELVDLDFFRFSFFLMLGSSAEGVSLNISDSDCCRMDSPKSVETKKEDQSITIFFDNPLQ